VVKPFGVDFFDDVVRLYFGDSYSFVIDVNEDKIYLNGKRVVTSGGRFFHPNFLKKKNLEYPPKRNLFVLDFLGFVLKVDVGYDGRVFWLVFNKSDYTRFRHPPVWQFSYWHNRYKHQKEFFLNDLSNPVRVYRKLCKELV